MAMERLLRRLKTEDDGAMLVSEVADVLNCSRSYIYKLIKARSIEFGRVGTDYRIPIQEARKLAREAGIIRE